MGAGQIPGAGCINSFSFSTIYYLPGLALFQGGKHSFRVAQVFFSFSRVYFARKKKNNTGNTTYVQAGISYDRIQAITSRE